jgi:hypothetical protein
MFCVVDKMCDQISDAVLDAHLQQDPDAKVACETVTKTGMIMVRSSRCAAHICLAAVCCPWVQCSGSGIRCLFDPWIRDPG